MQYLCKAGQQVRAKAQDSAPDKDRMPLLGAPSLAGQASTGSANAAGWLSTESGQLTLLCLLYQQGLGRSDYWTSTTFQEPSTDIGYKKKKRLAKSGKDNVYLQSSFYTDHIDVCIQLEILVEKQVLEISKYSNIVVGIVRTCIFCYIVCVKLVNLFFVFHIHVFSSFANVKQVAGNIES